MKNALIIFCLSLTMAGTLSGQDARLELNSKFHVYSPRYSSPDVYQLPSFGLMAEKLFAKHFGWHAGFSIGRVGNVDVDINDVDLRGSTSFFSFEPGIAYHTGQNMNGFMVDFTLRSGMQHNKASYTGSELEDNYFYIGPELGLGFNTTLKGDWCIGGIFGGGLLASEFEYIHLFGGISVSKRF